MLSVINNLNERIKKIREDNKMSRRFFAKSLFISVSYLGELESGKKKPSDSLLLLISLRYAVPFIWLKFGETLPDKIAENKPIYALPYRLQDIIDKIKTIYFESSPENLAKIIGMIELALDKIKEKKEVIVYESKKEKEASSAIESKKLRDKAG